MSSEINQLSNYMKNFSINLLGHAVEHAVLFSVGNAYWHAFGVLHAAQAAEIMIKSCIAKEHPLLIFTKLPTVSDGADYNIDVLQDGKTLSYFELPKTLESVTGYTLKNPDMYKSFGKLRNTIQHLHVPQDKNLPKEILSFVCSVLDPLTRHFWGSGTFEGLLTSDTSVIDFLERRLEEYGIPYEGWLPNENYAITEQKRHMLNLQKLNESR